jgi:hypothetical protein
MVPYVKKYVHVHWWEYLPQFFLERETTATGYQPNCSLLLLLLLLLLLKVVRKIKVRILPTTPPPRKSGRPSLWEKVKKIW